MEFFIATASGREIEDGGEKRIYRLDQLVAIARKYGCPIVITPPEMKCDFNEHNELPTLLIADYYLG